MREKYCEQCCASPISFNAGSEVRMRLLNRATRRRVAERRFDANRRSDSSAFFAGFEIRVKDRGRIFHEPGGHGLLLAQDALED
jgi:hypothetical protein